MSASLPAYSQHSSNDNTSSQLLLAKEWHDYKAAKLFHESGVGHHAEWLAKAQSCLSVVTICVIMIQVFLDTNYHISNIQQFQTVSSFLIYSLTFIFSFVVLNIFGVNWNIYFFYKLKGSIIRFALFLKNTKPNKCHWT